MSNVLLQLNHIIKSYADGIGTQTVLKDVSLEVKAGEFVAIVGPSGSGKSTLLSVAGLLLSPDSGEVIIAGSALSQNKEALRAAMRRDHIGFIFQTHQLLPYLNARDQLTLFQNKRYRCAVSADALLDDLGIADCENKYPANMSGGEKQRVAIARAFINDPDIILADEPTASLDSARGRQVVELIRDQAKKRGKAALMVTHDERVLDLTDRVLRLEDGTLRSFV